tara:strand:- start:51 stop:248 length:198 start_codon:yes stop_codon:yes gene_type:complete
VVEEVDPMVQPLDLPQVELEEVVEEAPEQVIQLLLEPLEQLILVVEVVEELPLLEVLPEEMVLQV